VLTGVPRLDVAIRKALGFLLTWARKQTTIRMRRSNPGGALVDSSSPVHPSQRVPPVLNLEQACANASGVLSWTRGQNAWQLSPAMIHQVQRFSERAIAGGLPDPARRIISGYRDPEVQRRMREAWDAGDREGLAYRPALNSAHCEGNAIDLRGTNDELADYGSIWLSLGNTWGGLWVPPDRGHFQLG